MPTAGVTANFAIGQGDTTTTPLQMARVYAAVANGGTFVTPHIGRAVMTPEGEPGPQDPARVATGAREQGHARLAAARAAS